MELRATGNRSQQVCAYCNTPDYTVVIRVPKGTAVRCSRCKLVRSLPYPSFEYEGNDEYGSLWAGADREQLFVDFARQFMQFIARHTSGVRLLEIGSGMGYLLVEAERSGFRSTGIEVNHWEVAETRRRGLDVQECTLEDADIAPGSVDVVCMSHLLEHVKDLRSLLLAVNKVLRPGGIVVVSQPHYAAPLPRMLRQRWYGWQWEQHIWHFDVPTLSNVFADYDFMPIDVEYNSLYHQWLPTPWTWKPHYVVGYVGIAAIARAETLLGHGDQFFLAVRYAGNGLRGVHATS